MHHLKIAYGKDYLQADLPYPYENITISDRELSYTSEQEVERALLNPIGASIEDMRGAKNAVIVTSDATRPVPNHLLIPALLEELNKIGVKEKDVTVLIGTGLHRVVPQEECKQIVGEDVYSRVKVVSHDAWDDHGLKRFGTTSRGTPVVVNKIYAEADAKIAIGVLDPHQFAGYAAGAKAVSIGLGGEAQIQANHAMLTRPNAELGIIKGNPIREDIDEIGAMVGIDFILNVVLNSRKEIVHAVAGHFLEAHRVGVELSKNVLQVPVAEPGDLVIAGGGGYPKDIDLYQAQKALLHATFVVKEGGTLILVAKCEEGIGSEKFKQTMKLGESIQEVLKKFAKMDFYVGGHKAYLWGQSLLKANVIIVSDGLTYEDAQIMKVKKVETLQQAIDMAQQDLSRNPKVLVIPKASSTIPMLTQDATVLL